MICVSNASPGMSRAARDEYSQPIAALSSAARE